MVSQWGNGRARFDVHLQLGDCSRFHTRQSDHNGQLLRGTSITEGV